MLRETSNRRVTITPYAKASPWSNNVATPARSRKKENARTSNKHAIEAHRKYQQTMTNQWPRVQIFPPCISSLQQYSHSYSNAYETLHYSTVLSEQQARAHPVCATVYHEQAMSEETGADERLYRSSSICLKRFNQCFIGIEPLVKPIFHLYAWSLLAP